MPGFDLAAMQWQDAYRILIDCIVPRPIGFISTINSEGVPNLAPFSFFNMVSANPPVVFFAPSLYGRNAQKKDSFLNVEQVPEFVASIVNEDIAERMNQCSFAYPHGVSEFEKAGLTPLSATVVRPPLVSESPVNIECRVIDIKSFGDAPGAGSVIFGEILYVHLHEGLLDEKSRISAHQLRAIGRLGGSDYCRTRDVFSMHRPKEG